MGGPQDYITAFICLAAEDPRIRPVHITLFLALWHTWQSTGGALPIGIARADLMHLAKVSARQTYNAAIIELDAYGYIRYEPSYDPRVKSRVWLMTK